MSPATTKHIQNIIYEIYIFYYTLLYTYSDILSRVGLVEVKLYQGVVPGSYITF